MTELERQLTAALERLSTQYEMEQRRHSEQVERQAAQSEILRHQTERLSRQMTSLAADYGTLPATLR